MNKVQRSERYKIAAIVLAAIFAVMSVTPTAARKSVKRKLPVKVTQQAKPDTLGGKPDFAYPQDAVSNAEKEMKKAMAAGNEGRCVDAAIRIVIAKNLISTDNASAMAQMLDSLACAAAQPYRSIYYSLEAQLYNQLYQSGSYRYSQRNLPLDKFPENPSDWSKELFSLKVTELVKKSLEDSNGLKATSISSLKEILTSFDVLGEKSVPNAYDLLAKRGVELLSPFVSHSRMLPFGSGDTKLSVDMQASALRTEILESLVDEFTPYDNPLAYTNALYAYASTLGDDEIFKYLMSHYPELKDTEGGPILLTYADAYLPASFSEEWMNFYREAKEVVTLQRDFPGRSSLLNTIADMEQGSVSLDYPSKALPGKPVEVKVKTENLASYWLLMVKCDEQNHSGLVELKDILNKCSIVEAVRVESSSAVPSFSHDSVTFAGVKPGCYAILPSRTKSLDGLITGKVISGIVDVMEVTAIEILTSASTNPSSGKAAGSVFVVSAENGKPIKGAEVKFYKDNRKLSSTSRTDARGSVAMSLGYFRVVASYNGNHASSYANLYSGYRENGDIKSVKILTDLSIYHPGDSIGTAAVAVLTKNGQASLLKGENIKLSLRDDNYEEVDSLSGMTDEAGRLYGYLHIPNSGLLGTYSIQAEIDNNYVTSSYVEVAEYKAPTFFVEVEGADGEVVVGEDVKITGKAMTYSGLPVADAEIAFVVNYRPVRWWQQSTPNAAFAANTSTDAEGKFTITLPTERLKGTPFVRGIFEINVSATSPSGETARAPMQSFSIGEGYHLAVASELDIEVPADGVCNIPVSVVDFLGKTVDFKIDYTIKSSSGKVLMSDAFAYGARAINLSSLPSGEYSLYLRAATRDSVAAESRLILYRAGDKKPPMKTQLWVPEANIYASSGGKAEVKVGSSYPDSYIFCQISDTEGFFEEKWLEVSDGIVKVPVNCRKENSRVALRFASWRDFDNKNAVVTVRPASDLNKFEIFTLSFRDKISAGDKENWKFHITYADKAIPCAPAIAVLNNKSLTAIAPFNWRFNGKSNISSYIYSSIASYGAGTTNSHFAVPCNKYYLDDWMMMPEINLYDMSLVGNYYGSSITMRKMSSSGVSAEAVANEFEMIMEDSADEVPVAAMKVRGTNQMLAAGKEESAEEEDGAAAESAKEELRPVEMPLAFFKPSLTADKDGNLDISFEVPNFNTSWLFNMLSYDESLNSGILTLETVASKPVMVQSNLPRFLRTGDSITLPATIYNNTDEEMDATAVIELFDPTDGGVVTKKEFTITGLGAKASKVVGLDYEVPATLSLIGYRVICTSGKYSDGEQDVIGILPSSTPVVEAIPFHLSSLVNSAEVKLPALNEEASVTLRYCGNPVWYCVTALPAITTADSDNLFALLPPLYANSVSAGLAEKYPQIGEALDYWMKNPADSMLVSNLERNSELKIFALNNTPWVNNARSESLRMSRLINITNRDEARQAISSLIGKVLALQNGDGSFSWCKGMNGDYFASSIVLCYMGMLADMDYLPESKELNNAIARLIRYNQKELVRMSESNKSIPVKALMSYLYGVKNLKNNRDAVKGFTQLRSKGIKELAGGWKKMDISDAATAAIVLACEGETATAQNIIESLRQRAMTSDAGGMWYDNIGSGYNGVGRLLTTARVLDAFVVVKPEDVKSIDAIRQYLVLQRRVEDWGSASATCSVINSILTSGSEWKSDVAVPVFTLGGKQLEIAANPYTGEVMTTIPAPQASGATLLIERESGSTAWGAVTAQYVENIADVKAASVPDLSISKQIVLVDNSADGTLLTPASKLRKGQLVRVILTLNSSRDMNYVAVNDQRGACMEPVEQLSFYKYADGIAMYQEVRNAATNFFIGFLPKGSHIITYDCRISEDGQFSIGIATAQSQYAPDEVTHSAGEVLEVKGE